MQYKLKNSNIEWLGDIPEHWEIDRLKDVAKIITGKTPLKSDKKNYENGNIVWVKPDLLRGGNINDSKIKITKYALQWLKIIPKNSILVGCIGDLGNYAVAKCDLTTNQQINSIIFNEKKINFEYGKYVIEISKTEHWRLSTVVVIHILNKSRQSLIKLPIPPLNEQQAIADYLDKKCGDIDAIISGRKQQVKQLKNYRQALIFESVTKGLDKTAKLKNSNIEWLGKIPEHWSIKKMSELTTFHVGFTPESKNTEFYGEKHKWITIDDIKNGVVVKNNKRSLSDLGVKGRQDKLTKKGSLLYSFKLTVGKTAFAQEDCYTNEAIASFKPTKKLDMRYFKYSIGDYLINYANENIYGAPLLNDTLIKCARILIPPLNEQQAIADYLDKKCGNIDNTITALNTQIQQLSDYRKSLIFECITGKKQIV